MAAGSRGRKCSFIRTSTCNVLAEQLRGTAQFPPAVDRYGQPVQHGRRRGSAGRSGRVGRAARRHAAGRRSPRHGRFRPARVGTSRTAGVACAVHVRVGTLSKALGSAGGFVAGSRVLIDWLVNRARPYVFSTAHPPAACAAALAAIDIVRHGALAAQDAAGSRAARLRARLVGRWLEHWAQCASQIIPLIVGEPAATMRLSEVLGEQGFWVPGIRPPSVPAGESLLRVSVSYGHTTEQLDDLADALGRLRSLMGRS